MYLVSSAHSVCFIINFLSDFIKVCVDLVFCMKEFGPLFRFDGIYNVTLKQKSAVLKVCDTYIYPFSDFQEFWYEETKNNR